MSDCIPFDIQKEIIKKVYNVKSLVRFFYRQKKMMEDIPFDIQMEIITRLPVKPLIRFRSVSKPWKSFIDSSSFIKSYGARKTHPHSCSILSYRVDNKAKFSFLEDDDKETYKIHKQELARFVVSPLLRQYHVVYVVGACHGLLCLLCYTKDNYRQMLVIWNPSIGKSFSIVVPSIELSFFGIVVPSSIELSLDIFGFGVCPVTRDPIVVRIVRLNHLNWHVDVFALSSGGWNVFPSGNRLRESVRLNKSAHVVIDRLIYWGATERTYANDGEPTLNHMLVSFDLITKEFRVINLPDSLTNELYGRFPMSVCMLRESLVVYGCIMVEEALSCGVWVMEHDLSFTKLFTISAHVDKILGFRKSGEPVFEAHKGYGEPTTLDVYDPRSQQIKNLGIVGSKGSFFTDSYKESLLLLDHSDLQIYGGDN